MASFTMTPEFEENVDLSTFNQILEMDESGHDFSFDLVIGFFAQARDTIADLNKAYEKKDLGELSKRGHFLKGSSATLGFNKVRDSCQIIQQYGSNCNIDGTPEDDDQICLNKIKAAIGTVEEAQVSLRRLLPPFFGKTSEEFEAAIAAATSE